MALANMGRICNVCLSCLRLDLASFRLCWSLKVQTAQFEFKFVWLLVWNREGEISDVFPCCTSTALQCWRDTTFEFKGISWNYWRQILYKDLCSSTDVLFGKVVNSRFHFGQERRSPVCPWIQRCDRRERCRKVSSDWSPEPSTGQDIARKLHSSFMQQRHTARDISIGSKRTPSRSGIVQTVWCSQSCTDPVWSFKRRKAHHQTRSASGPLFNCSKGVVL